ncbi:hypothetical protein [Deinococcus sp.]|uniref:hypothetical protein n=1 Tax=Deinococcus sp. TaxID=47478 RepID=UPI003B5CB9F5
MSAPAAIADAQDITLGLAQAVSLNDNLTHGLSAQSARTPVISSVPVNDFLGQPFVYLNVTSDGNIDVLQEGLKLSGNEANRYFINLVGASTVRDVKFASSNSAQPLVELARTVKAVGGKGRVKGLVTIDGVSLLVEDKKGNFWVSGSDQPLSSEVVKDLKAEYQKALDTIGKNPDTISALKHEWEYQLTGATQATSKNPNAAAPLSIEGSRLASYLNADGTLDVAKSLKDAKVGQNLSAQSGIGKQSINAAGLTAQYTYGYEYKGYIGSGYAQNTGMWLGYDQNFRLPSFIGGSLNWVNQNAIGCAAAAGQALMYDLWVKGVRLYGKSWADAGYEAPLGYTDQVNGNFYGPNRNSNSNSFYRVVNRTDNPGEEGMPHMTRLMNGSWFKNGTLIKQWDFVSGMNAILNEAALGYSFSMDYEWKTYGAGSNGTMLRIIKGNLARGNPVIMEYSTPNNAIGLEGHYSPMMKARTESGWFGVGTFVYAVSYDHPNWDTSISNRWAPFMGAFTVR